MLISVQLSFSTHSIDHGGKREKEMAVECIVIALFVTFVPALCSFFRLIHVFVMFRDHFISRTLYLHMNLNLETIVHSTAHYIYIYIYIYTA